VGSVVIFVRDIEQSLRFYCDVLGCVVAIHDRSAVLMIAPGGFQIYLRALGDRAHHPSHQIGVQSLIWTTASRAGLEQVEQAMRDRNCYIDTSVSDGVTFVTGHDLDLIPVLVAYPSPQRLPRHSISRRVYNP
jgi:catechol 2,3-dioxygenase-like lactoylglutathione lyase family enzyme